MTHHLDFLGKAKIFVPLSITLVLVSWILLVPGVRGVNPGIDFTGGTSFTIIFNQSVSTGSVRSALAKVQAGNVDLSKSVIRNVTGTDQMLITTQLNVETQQDAIDTVKQALQSEFPVKEISTESIGHTVSRELTQKAWQAVLLALVMILIYVSWRFRLRYAVGAVVALIHDVSIAMGVFALFHIEFNLDTIAAFLTIIGYSLNDTIVIFDRIRENVQIHKKMGMFELINLSVNQSLSRTINTSLTTLMPVLILLVFGGAVLQGFSLALFIGIVVGTYSSMYIASPILYGWTLQAAKAKQRR